MQFASTATARTYSDRVVDRSWIDWAALTLAPQGKDVVDIGCGGGIYSYGFAEAGARSVIGIDQSEQYVDEAAAGHVKPARLMFKVGSAEQTDLTSDSADIVFQRALVHHLGPQAKESNAAEVMRLLREGGLFAAQDRTIEDALSAAPEHWIRATLFEVFPRLVNFEEARRPSRQEYSNILAKAGFVRIKDLRYDEVRKTYSSFDALRDEILCRKGKSILFELTDSELERYCEHLRSRAPSGPLVERDLWTVWLATK
jgi:SAM-dependent methyltransferase